MIQVDNGQILIPREKRIRNKDLKTKSNDHKIIHEDAQTNDESHLSWKKDDNLTIDTGPFEVCEEIKEEDQETEEVFEEYFSLA